MDTARVDRLVAQLDATPSTARLLVALAGVPAAGKSTLAHRLVQLLNARLAARADPAAAVLVGLDGWHCTRAQLDAMDDPREAHARRGSHWTFDAHAYVDFVARLRRPIDRDTGVLYAPAFDHAVKDPTPDAIVVTPAHRIVVIEGLYTMLDLDPWREAAAHMDERWWIQVDPVIARERLVHRHVQTGVAKDMDEAVWRAENNDEDNGRFIASRLFDVTHTIQSIDDPAMSTRV